MLKCVQNPELETRVREEMEADTDDKAFCMMLQLAKLRYGALGACSELTGFFFELLHPDLLSRYREVAGEVAGEGRGSALRNPSRGEGRVHPLHRGDQHDGRRP